jgi:hypothetical protein
MKCSVCRKDFGLWAKIGGHTSVCKECQEQGRNHLQVLAESVRSTQVWKQQFAQRWLTEFEDTVRKFQIADSDAAPFRSMLLNAIFKLVEMETEMSDSDINFLSGLQQRYVLALSSPEIRETMVRIGLRQTIEAWERGEAPQRQCSGLVLQKGEICHWEESVGLHVQKNRREYVGGYASVSIPVGRGTRIRVGGFKGFPIDKTVYDDGGRGILHITNQRVCFAGQLQSVNIPFSKMINLKGFADGFIIQTSNEKKPGIFVVGHPELTAHLVMLAASQQEEEPPTKRRKKVPSPA